MDSTTTGPADLPPLDPGRVTQRLGMRIAQLEVTNAELEALCQQLAEQGAVKDARLAELTAKTPAKDSAEQQAAEGAAR